MEGGGVFVENSEALFSPLSLSSPESHSVITIRAPGSQDNHRRHTGASLPGLKEEVLPQSCISFIMADVTLGTSQPIWRRTVLQALSLTHSIGEWLWGWPKAPGPGAVRAEVLLPLVGCFWAMSHRPLIWYVISTVVAQSCCLIWEHVAVPLTGCPGKGIPGQDFSV